MLTNLCISYAKEKNMKVIKHLIKIRHKGILTITRQTEQESAREKKADEFSSIACHTRKSGQQ